MEFHERRLKKEAKEISELIEIALREQQFKYGRMKMGEKFLFFDKQFNKLVDERHLHNIKSDLFLHCSMLLHPFIDDGPVH
ncbi:hypothetical protein [Bacillus pinisoli]|uniref:hypothetical protein n=1 Tax=Bacillus pinisoli TaxID=2901866 RepID=UPI001FF3F4CD|nr:hypothetical protein [Bacillus pinisoli]